ncbi:MAG: sterol desaturase family protein [Prolixibacteraceae bacterium]
METIRNDESRLFDNQMMEVLSRSNAIAVITLYYIISGAIVLYGAVESGLAFSTQVLLFVSGLIAFTLTEYLVHRYIYHSLRLKKMESWFYIVHEIHHQRPKDKKRLTLPLIVAVLAGPLVYLIFWLFLRNYTLFFFPGFLSGYASYLLIHYSLHTQNFKNGMFRYLWKHHAIHHFKNDQVAYGVSSPLWDLVFGTMPSKEQRNF